MFDGYASGVEVSDFPFGGADASGHECCAGVRLKEFELRQFAFRGTRRRSSLKKFNKTVMWTVALSSPLFAGLVSATKRLPSGARSKLQRLRLTGRKMGVGDHSVGFPAANESLVAE